MPLTTWRQFHASHFEGRRALVTGGAGFIGSHLAQALLDLGAQVVVLDDYSGGSCENVALLDDPRGQLKVVEGSILNRELLQQSVDGCDLVFHQAALGSVPRSLKEPELFVQVNVAGTLNVLEAARSAGVKRIMFAGSSSAYGDTPTLPKIETMMPRPRSPYAATKLAGEHLLSSYSASLGLDTATLRYFNIFGPRQNANSAYAAVIAAFAKSLLAGERPRIFGDGSQSRDFTFVDNAVHANLLAARAQQPLGGRAINVATGVRITVTELAVQMAQLLNRPDLEPEYLPQRAGDVLHSQADLSLAQQVLGYEPIVDFDAGLRQTVAWYQQAFAQN